MKRIALYLAAAVLLCGNGMARAGLLTFSGTWNSDTTTIPAEVSGPLGGSFSFTFDDSVVTGSGLFGAAVALDSFSFTGNNYGGFNISNVGATLRYFDGDLDWVAVGGLINGARAVVPNTDDFYVYFEEDGTLQSGFNPVYAKLGLVTFIPRGEDNTGSMTIGQIPEPSPLIVWSLLGLSSVGVSLWRRRKR